MLLVIITYKAISLMIYTNMTLKIFLKFSGDIFFIPLLTPVVKAAFIISMFLKRILSSFKFNTTYFPI